MRILLSILLTFLFTSKFGYSQQIVEKCPNYRSNYTYFAQAIGTNTYSYNWKVDYNGFISYYYTESINLNFIDSGYCKLELFIEDDILCESRSQRYEISIINCQETTFYLPNSFTPNGDGINDVFLPRGENFSDFEISIFNRWGQSIYQSTDTAGWNGGLNGYYVPDGVYSYVVTYRDIKKKPVLRTGCVIVIR
jgi:gliding motility-associated-like protein